MTLYDSFRSRFGKLLQKEKIRVDFFLFKDRFSFIERKSLKRTSKKKPFKGFSLFFSILEF